ncbi:MAG: hypothetical protein AUI14_24690 [Actinobacteria bacterium 13_2_20CM_2_71_6]|nr:MAG: hypothetical protein AUI14_24690 [Actinobacteria bacterium 13_2_20CM_2_71_6]
MVRLLNFAGVRIEQGHPTPARSPQPLPSLRSAALDEARRLAHFRIGVPAQLGVPDDVQLADPGPDGAPRVVSLLYRARAVRLDEFDGQLDWAYLKTQPAPDFQWVQIHDGSGMWLPTAHSVTYVDRQGQPHTETARLAGPTLIWTDGMVTYRLEGFSTLDQAISVALSVG